MLFQNPQAIRDLGFRKRKTTQKEDSNDNAAEENLELLMKRLDLKKDLLKLFNLDSRYNKKTEVNELGSSDVHLHVRPPPGVNYNVKGINIKGGNYVGKQTKFAPSIDIS